jgi:antitoxin VapB
MALETAMAKARLFWSGRSQAVRLPKEFRFRGEEVRIRRRGSAVILEPSDDDWSWLDAIVGTLDDDFVQAVNKRPEQQERPALDEAFRWCAISDANAVIALLSDASSRQAERARREKPSDVAISAIVAH